MMRGDELFPFILEGKNSLRLDLSILAPSNMQANKFALVNVVGL